MAPIQFGPTIIKKKCEIYEKKLTNKVKTILTTLSVAQIRLIFPPKNFVHQAWLCRSARPFPLSKI